MQHITVLGSGVIGLSSAVRLQQAGYAVTIVTRELPEQTTSAAAGAIWWGYQGGRPRRWSEESLGHFQRLSQQSGSGVLQITLRDVYAEAAAEPWFKDRLDQYRQIPADELPAGYVTGFEMVLPLIEPPVYLRSLRQQFEQAGGTSVIREVDSLETFATEDRLIVHCTGVGARQVAADTRVYPIRGQTVLVEAPSIEQGFMDDEAFTYIFPRTDGVLLGGIAQPGNYSLDPDPDITQEIMERCQQIEPTLGYEAIIGHTVGLRPGRDEVRLEMEQLSSGRTVIHNYGHGAVGFTLSWGCAGEVVELAKQTLSADA
jgi:D-amino-acid oxidase